MNSATQRAWWSYRQGLDGRLRGRDAAGVLEETGWARSVGGANPYLTLFARAGTSRATADAAAAALHIHELPSARGCTYVVPGSDFALALRVGGTGDADMRTARKLGVTDKEVDRLMAAFIKPSRTLNEAVAETEAWIREDLGDVRSFSLDSPKSRLPRIEALRHGGLKTED
jgi:hypothetical protein